MGSCKCDPMQKPVVLEGAGGAIETLSCFSVIRISQIPFSLSVYGSNLLFNGMTSVAAYGHPMNSSYASAEASGCQEGEGICQSKWKF